MPAGIGASNYMAIVPEVTMGTYLPPTTAGAIFVPFLTESLVYNETKYVSKQIRQSAVASEVAKGPYHVEGDITMEADTQFLPMLLYASRHTITKTGAAAPFTYTFVPSSAGSASSTVGLNQRTLSISVVRNGVGFGYGGCTLGSISFTVEDGVLRFTAAVRGLTETDPAANGTPAWVNSKLLGADTMAVFTDAAGASPTFAAAAVVDFNGYTFEANHNPDPQNRIVRNRGAGYIKFGETEVTVNTELDFIDKSEYNNFKNSTYKAIRLEALGDGVTAFTTSDNAIRIDLNRAFYSEYTVDSGAMDDIVSASSVFTGVGVAGGSAYKISVKSTQDVT